MSVYGTFLFLHLAGVALWLGTTFTLAFVTGGAVRSGDRSLAAFAYATAARLHKSLGLVAILLTLAGGIGLMVVRGHAWFQPFPNHWLFQMQLLGFLAMAVGLLYLIPMSDRLADAAEASAAAGEDSAAYLRYRRRNAWIGSILGVLLLINVLLGSLRPA